MNITVEFAAQLKRAAGVATDAYALDDNATLQSLADAIAERHGDAVRKILLTDDGSIHPSIWS